MKKKKFLIKKLKTGEKINFLLFYFALFFAVGTNVTVIDSSKLAGDLNNQAVLIMKEFPNSAVSLLDKTILLDKSCQAAFYSKTAIYCSKGECKKAIKIRNQILEVNPGSGAAAVSSGMVNDYTN